MRISARADYAVRAAVALAKAPEDERLRADTIATTHDIPGNFLEGILTELRRAGLVESRRGTHGGFRLALPASDVSIADVIRAVEGPLVYVRDRRPSDVEYRGAEALVDVWVALRASVRRVLEVTTVAHVAEGRLPEDVRALAEDPAAWKQSGPLN